MPEFQNFKFDSILTAIEIKQKTMEQPIAREVILLYFTVYIIISQSLVYINQSLMQFLLQ